MSNKISAIQVHDSYLHSVYLYYPSYIPILYLSIYSTNILIMYWLFTIAQLYSYLPLYNLCHEVPISILFLLCPFNYSSYLSLFISFIYIYIIFIIFIMNLHLTFELRFVTALDLDCFGYSKADNSRLLTIDTALSLSCPINRYVYCY